MPLRRIIPRTARRIHRQRLTRWPAEESSSLATTPMTRRKPRARKAPKKLAPRTRGSRHGHADPRRSRVPTERRRPWCISRPSCRRTRAPADSARRCRASRSTRRRRASRSRSSCRCTPRCASARRSSRSGRRSPSRSVRARRRRGIYEPVDAAAAGHAARRLRRERGVLRPSGPLRRRAGRLSRQRAPLRAVRARRARVAAARAAAGAEHRARARLADGARERVPEAPSSARIPTTRESAPCCRCTTPATRGTSPSRRWPTSGCRWRCTTRASSSGTGRVNLLKGGLVVLRPRDHGEPDARARAAHREGRLRARRRVRRAARPARRHRQRHRPGSLGSGDATRSSRAATRRDNMSGKKRCRLALQRATGLEPVAGADLRAHRAARRRRRGSTSSSATRATSPSTRSTSSSATATRATRRCSPSSPSARRAASRVKLDFTDEFEHLLLAGADMCLMPSQYEPCGLTQMRAQRYGTIPVARRVGGLADTIEDGVTASCSTTTRRPISCAPRCARWISTATPSVGGDDARGDGARLRLGEERGALPERVPAGARASLGAAGSSGRERSIETRCGASSLTWRHTSFASSLRSPHVLTRHAARRPAEPRRRVAQRRPALARPRNERHGPAARGARVPRRVGRDRRPTSTGRRKPGLTHRGAAGAS